MKRLIITIVLLITFLTPQEIAAQIKETPMPINVRNLVKERINTNKDARESIRIKIEEKTATKEAVKEQLQAKLKEKRQERIRTLFGKFTTRIEAAIGRLNTLIERMEERTAILEKEGENVTNIQSEIDSARTLLVSAEDSLTIAKEGLESVVASEDPKAGFTYIQDIVKDIKLTLTDVHSILVQTIGDMKGLRVQAEEKV